MPIKPSNFGGTDAGYFDVPEDVKRHGPRRWASIDKELQQPEWYNGRYVGAGPDHLVGLAPVVGNDAADFNAPLYGYAKAAPGTGRFAQPGDTRIELGAKPIPSFSAALGNIPLTSRDTTMQDNSHRDLILMAKLAGLF